MKEYQSFDNQATTNTYTTTNVNAAPRSLSAAEFAIAAASELLALGHPVAAEIVLDKYLEIRPV